MNLTTFFHPNLKVLSVSHTDSSIIINLISQTIETQCPLCASKTVNKHSYYIRQVSDVTLLDKQVKLHMKLKSFSV